MLFIRKFKHYCSQLEKHFLLFAAFAAASAPHPPPWHHHYILAHLKGTACKCAQLCKGLLQRHAGKLISAVLLMLKINQARAQVFAGSKFLQIHKWGVQPPWERGFLLWTLFPNTEHIFERVTSCTSCSQFLGCFPVHFLLAHVWAKSKLQITETPPGILVFYR